MRKTLSMSRDTRASCTTETPKIKKNSHNDSSKQGRVKQKSLYATPTRLQKVRLLTIYHSAQPLKPDLVTKQY